MKEKLKVGAYCRVSSDSGDQANSLESQKKYFTEYINKNEDWELADIYADDGISGTQTENRIQFNKMIEDAQYKKIDLILTKEISRFARNTRDSIHYTRLLKKLGIGVIFINDNINTLDGDGELRLTIMSGIAQDESRRTSERVKWGQKRRMEQGIVFGRELLGYKLKNGVLTINEEESYIVKLIFQKYIIEGKGTHVIARELYEANILSKSSKSRWSNTMILKVLRNEKYVGDLAQKKTFTPDYLDHKKKYNKGNEEMIYLKDHHIPIIDRETWEATQIQLERRSPSQEEKSRYSNRYWCSGKLICRDCGSKFISRTKKLKNRQVYKAWRCFNAANHGTSKIDSIGNQVGCNLGSVNHVILGKVIGIVLDSINSNKEEIISKLMPIIKELKKTKTIKNTDSFRNKINSLNAKKQKAIDSMIEGIISKDDLVLINKKYDSEISKINIEIKNIEDVNFENSKKGDNLQIIIDRIKEIVTMKNMINIDEVYKQMVEKIVVHKENVLELFLTCMVTPIKVQYSSKGRHGKYTVEVNFID